MPTIKIKNSQTATNTPSSLVPGEIAINEQDELLFYRDGAGAVQSADLNAEANTINSDPTGVTGADQITNTMSLTQAEYDAIVTKDASTLYIII